MEHKEEIGQEKNISRAERWNNEQKMKTQQGRQIMQAALDSGLINKNFTMGELHAKIPSPSPTNDLTYFLFGSSFFLLISEYLTAPKDDPCGKEKEPESYSNTDRNINFR